MQRRRLCIPGCSTACSDPAAEDSETAALATPTRSSSPAATLQLATKKPQLPQLRMQKQQLLQKLLHPRTRSNDSQKWDAGSSDSQPGTQKQRLLQLRMELLPHQTQRLKKIQPSLEAAVYTESHMLYKSLTPGPQLGQTRGTNHFQPGNGGSPWAHAAEATGEDKPEDQGGSGSLAGILSGIVLAAVGSVSGYFAYQKKKLCFSNRQEADPEAARKADATEAQSDPQVLSTLLKSS
ncbi:skin secretory protein xP2-like protein [Lates japonicus]|uniref:Skin secretory protein xP2-like protein n=1 Tax=Lates japonicus TaxID=270547 RepID=A0AAD3MU67_LATJO|nr:skin secretory protein xP2-like protein [Lates japonicus]